MPVIKSALRHSKHKGWKPKTRDPKKYQHTFDFEPDVLTVEKIRQAFKRSMESKPKDFGIIPPDLVDLAQEIATQAGKTVNDILAKETVEGNLTTGKWADEVDTDFPAFDLIN